VIVEVARTALHPSLLPPGVVVARRDGWAVQHARSPFLGKPLFAADHAGRAAFGARPPRCGEATASSAEAITACRDDRAAYRTRSHLMEVAALFAVILEVARQATTSVLLLPESSRWRARHSTSSRLPSGVGVVRLVVRTERRSALPLDHLGGALFFLGLIRVPRRRLVLVSRFVVAFGWRRRRRAPAVAAGRPSVETR
jgi:hypothetical protein